MPDNVVLPSQSGQSSGNRKEQTRRKNVALILSAAEEEFVRNGFRGASVQAVADRAGLPKANVLYYFRTKQDLYMEVLSRILDLWNSSFDEVTEEDDPAEALANYIRSKMVLSCEYPNASKLYASEVIQGARYLSDYLKQVHADWTNHRAEVIQCWIDAGKMKAIDPRYLLFMIWGATQHYADFSAQAERILGGPMNDQDFRQATDTVIEIILSGCGLTPPSAEDRASC